MPLSHEGRIKFRDQSNQQLEEIIRTIKFDREEHQLALSELQARRQEAIISHLNELKRPHWIHVLGFIAATIAAIAAAVTAIPVLRSCSQSPPAEMSR